MDSLPSWVEPLIGIAWISYVTHLCNKEDAEKEKTENPMRADGNFSMGEGLIGRMVSVPKYDSMEQERAYTTKARLARIKERLARMDLSPKWRSRLVEELKQMALDGRIQELEQMQASGEVEP